MAGPDALPLVPEHLGTGPALHELLTRDLSLR